MATDKSEKLAAFTDFVAKHISGDEKSEAQVFLDRLFQAFGHKGLMEANAKLEMRVKKEDKTSFADLVWKPTVVIEMKKRGADLSKHYAQAFQYWLYLVPDRPRYAVLCNFDEFWIYDFNSQMDTPVDKVLLKDLPTSFGALNFLFPGDVAPVFGNHQEEVTRQAADKLAKCFRSMVKRGTARPLAQRFILQVLVALFAEDIGLLEKYFVVNLLNECHTPQDTFDLLGGLFAAMNTPGGISGGRFKGVAYFNGGLFADPARVELIAEERTLLKEAATESNWAKVRPEIFGTIFEHSLADEERSALGAHYTSPVDIMKIVGPTVVEPWSKAIAAATTLKGLKKLLVRLENFTVLDPACGSGNFLYTVYRELKKLEALIYERMAEFESIDPKQRPFGFLTTRNFYGIDVNSFAVDLAKVTMMLAHKLSIDELHIQESALPLDNLDANFRAGDALITQDGTKAEWFKTDVIIGNPPFLGMKLLKPKLGEAYVNRLRNAYPEVPGMADLCVYWIRRAADHVSPCTAQDPFAGRVGLVGTQNIRANESRVGGLDYLVQDSTIIEAVDNQPWSGEAEVYVSIVNWVKTHDPLLLPPKRRLWFMVKPTKKRPKGIKSSKHYELDMREVSAINSALSDKTDLKSASLLSCNFSPKRTFQGVTPGSEHFVLTDLEAKAQIAKESTAKDLLFPYLVGKQVLGDGTKNRRWLLDMGERDLLAAKGYPKTLKYIEETILPKRADAVAKAKNDGEEKAHHQMFLDRWWQLSYRRTDMLDALAGLKRYLVCSRVTTLPIFLFLEASVRPGDAFQVFAFEDDYSFGVLQSSLHIAWFLSKRSNMKVDPRYSSKNVFGTFPWPQNPTDTHIRAVAKAAKTLHNVRAAALTTTKGGLRAIYDTLNLPGKNQLRDAHEALNAAVMAAYGFNAKGDLLKQILSLNEQVALRIEQGEAVTGPGLPNTYIGPALISNEFVSF